MDVCVCVCAHARSAAKCREKVLQRRETGRLGKEMLEFQKEQAHLHTLGLLSSNQDSEGAGSLCSCSRDLEELHQTTLGAASCSGGRCTPKATPVHPIFRAY